MSWRGSVDADDAGGSTVTAAAVVDRWPVIAVFLAIPIWTGYYLTKGEKSRTSSPCSVLFFFSLSCSSPFPGVRAS